MAYTDWEVVAFEQPTAAKWNQLGENDAGFKDGTNFDDDIIGKRHIDWDDGIWWEELGRDTAAGNVSSLSVTGITAKKYLKIITTVLPSASTARRVQFNGDTSANYKSRFSVSGAADTDEAATGSGIPVGTTTSDPATCDIHVLNIAAQEKLVYASTTQRGSAGTGNSTLRMETSGKWVNTSNQITRVDLVASLAAGSEILVLGHD